MFVVTVLINSYICALYAHMTNLGSDDVKSALNTVFSELKIVDKLEEEDVRHFVWNMEDIPIYLRLSL